MIIRKNTSLLVVSKSYTIRYFNKTEKLKKELKYVIKEEKKRKIPYIIVS